MINLTFISPWLRQIEVDMKTLTSRHELGEWSLSYTPRNPSSVSVSVGGVTGLDIAPAFYRADGGSLRPSLQRLQGAPSQGKPPSLSNPQVIIDVFQQNLGDVQ